MKKKLKLDAHYKEEGKVEGIWKEMLMPGLAPLKTQFFPKEKTLMKLQNYGLSPFQGQGKLFLIMEEALAQRLAQVYFS